MKQLETNYVATGYVIGKHWSGGFGTYPSKKLGGFLTSDALIVSAEVSLKDGSLDSGMGFEYLTGARLDITEIRKIEFEGREYTYEETLTTFIGEGLTDELIEYLDNL